jgi:hypothetical protein
VRVLLLTVVSREPIDGRGPPRGTGHASDRGVLDAIRFRDTHGTGDAENAAGSYGGEATARHLDAGQPHA